MTEEPAATTSPRPGGQPAGKAPRGPQSEEALQTNRGQTSIADVVVTKVAGVATREVRGVHGVGGSGVSGALGTVTQAIGVSDQRTQGVSVEVGEKEAAVDLTIIVDYGESIPRVSQAVRDNVIRRIEGITGLRVTEVNVSVNDLYFPGDDQPDQSPRVA